MPKRIRMPGVMPELRKNKFRLFFCKIIVFFRVILWK